MSLFRPIVTAALTAVLAVSLAACGGSAKKNKERLQGDRIAVLTFDSRLQPDPRAQDLDVALPEPVRNRDWPQGGGFPAHAMQHLALDADPQRVWRTSIGAGSSGRRQLTDTPIVVDGRVFVIDTAATVSAIDARNGKRLWSRDIRPEKKIYKKVSFGGGVSYGNGHVIATTGYGVVAALDPETGREVWRNNIGVPLRGAPAIADGRVFVNTYDNQLFALTASSGEELWSYAGIIESAGLLGAATPAVAGGAVIAAFASGELFALAVENGRVTWSDTLTRTGRMTPLASLSDIDGSPVIDRGMVFAISHGGRMAGIDLRSGERLWERNVGGVHMPWVAGDFIFAVSADNEVVALSRRDGRVRWVTPVQRFKDQEDRKGRIYWAGPVLAGDRLVITSSHGYALSLSPYTGEILSVLQLSNNTYLPPVVADGTIYFLTDDGQLSAYR